MTTEELVEASGGTVVPLERKLEKRRNVKPTKAALKRQAKARADDIRSRFDSITEHFEALPQLIAEAWSEKDHEALGYGADDEGWLAYCEAEFGTNLIRVQKAIRKAMHKEIQDRTRELGHEISTRALGAATGSSQSTASRDVRPESNDSDLAPLPEGDDQVVGNDGLVILGDEDNPVLNEDVSTANPTTECEPFDHWDALAHALLSFTKNHALKKPTEKEIRTINGRLRKALKIMEDYQQ